jgi:guanylate kinase
MTGPKPRRGLCLVLAAPSGAGKTSISRALLAAEPDLHLSISVTTRAPRAGEQDGVHYFFRTRPAFDAMIEAGELLEWADVFGQRYGTPRAPVAAALARGEDVLFDIDWQGHRQLRAALPGDVVGVFIMPPRREDLVARLRARGDDRDEIARRMAEAEAEIAHAGEFDYCVVNEVLADAVATVRAILQAARAATARQLWLAP